MMKEMRGRVVSLPTERKTAMTALFWVLTGGALLGAAAFAACPEWHMWRSGIWNHGFLRLTVEQTLLHQFLKSFCYSASLLGILFLLGFSVIGQPASLLLLADRGAALGIASALAYSDYGLQGFFVVGCMLMPHVLFSSFLLVLAVRESLRNSNRIAGCAYAEMPEHPSLRLYLIRFAILLVLMLCSAAMDTGFSVLLTPRILPEGI